MFLQNKLGLKIKKDSNLEVNVMPKLTKNKAYNQDGYLGSAKQHLPK